MRILAVGSKPIPRLRRLKTRRSAHRPSGPAWPHPERRPATRHGSAARGFTLLELMVVVAIIAIATAGVSLALRDSTATQLEREAQRLSALLESGRAQSRTSGALVVWRTTENGFRFEGLAPQALPTQWLASDTRVRGTAALLLGPDPIIGAQEVWITSANQPERALRIATDGLRPFAVAAPTESP